MSKLSPEEVLLANEKGPSEQLVSIVPVPEGLMALTSTGRLFFRTMDNRSYNTTGINPGPKYLWREVEGPTL